MRFNHHGVILSAVLLLAACSGEGEVSSPGVGSPSPTSLEPADAGIAEVYNRSCRSCHAQGAASAPLTGDTKAWAPRMAQGMDILLEHTIDGYQGMPPRGMCFDCSDEQFRALILFMSGSNGE